MGLRKNCANCYYFMAEVSAEIRAPDNAVSAISGRGDYCEKKQELVKRHIACESFEPWDRRAFRKYRELTDLIESQEKDSMYRAGLQKQRNEVAEYLKSINPNIFSNITNI